MASKIRDRIVAHAVKGFADHGFAGCSTKEIAKRADVTEGSLFRLCSTKEKLFCEAVAVALASKKMRRTDLRLVAFALLEGRIPDEHRKALRRVAAVSPVIRELQSIAK